MQGFENEKGRLVVANPGLGYAWVLNHRAEPEVVVRSTEGASLTNVAFGGPGRTTLYATESISGSILRTELGVAGACVRRGDASVNAASSTGLPQRA